MALPEDELRKRLPNNTGSPALQGQPGTITGQPNEQVPTNLPASPSGGNANVASAPLSQNAANESQGGAGNSNVDLVEDRGTPIQYMQTNVNNIGSARALELAEGSARKARRQASGTSLPENQKQDGALPDASGAAPNIGTVSAPAPTQAQTPRQIQRNKEDASRIADDLGMTDDKQGEGNRASMENMFGNIYDNAVAQEVTAETITKNEGEKKKKKYRGVFAGMSREEFSLFLWDWGGALMANGDKGMRAPGFAGAAAMSGLQGRRETAAEQERVDTEALRTADLEERRMQVSERGALGTAGETIDTEGGMMQRTEKGTWEYIRNEDGEIVQKGYANRDYRGEKAWLAERYEEEGLSQSQINSLITGAKNPEERAQMLQDQLAKLKDSRIARDKNKKKYTDYTAADDRAWIVRNMQVADDAASDYKKQQSERAETAALDKY